MWAQVRETAVSSRAVRVLVAMTAGTFVAVLVAAQQNIVPGVHTPRIPLIAYFVVSGGLCLSPLGLRRPTLVIWAFLTWLPLEDLFRKLAGNSVSLLGV